MKYVKVNMNDAVKVKLTEEGIAILKQQHDEMNAFLLARGRKGLEDYSPRLDEDGYYQDQLWSLFQTFGKFIGLACPNMFDLDILLPIQQESDGKP